MKRKLGNFNVRTSLLELGVGHEKESTLLLQPTSHKVNYNCSECHFSRKNIYKYKWNVKIAQNMLLKEALEIILGESVSYMGGKEDQEFLKF